MVKERDFGSSQKPCGPGDRKGQWVAKLGKPVWVALTISLSLASRLAWACGSSISKWLCVLAACLASGALSGKVPLSGRPTLPRHVPAGSQHLGQGLCQWGCFLLCQDYLGSLMRGPCAKQVPLLAPPISRGLGRSPQPAAVLPQGSKEQFESLAYGWGRAALWTGSCPVGLAVERRQVLQAGLPAAALHSR